ncbi:hypothetical protein AL036_20715 [Salipiger aestuarii]|nr:hypothetical protein AL036_20715 [Salipiger aestuarii]KAA8606876.1 hypothetical protein AL037_19685 [Salipiger aestuarii]
MLGWRPLRHPARAAAGRGYAPQSGLFLVLHAGFGRLRVRWSVCKNRQRPSRGPPAAPSGTFATICGNFRLLHRLFVQIDRILKVIGYRS